MTPRLVVALATMLAVSLCVGTRVETQASSGPQDVVSALVDEMRALRNTIEAVASAGASGQLTLGRLQLQEQRLNVAITRLDATRERLESLQQDVVRQQAQAADLEAALKDPATLVSVSHPERIADRDGIEQMLKWQRTEIAASAATIQRLTAEEAALAGDLALEQSRWSDFELPPRGD
jgi:chromosome segregation ATPase